MYHAVAVSHSKLLIKKSTPKMTTLKFNKTTPSSSGSVSSLQTILTLVWTPLLYPLSKLTYWSTASLKAKNNPFLNGNYAPIQKETLEPVEVVVKEGSIPNDLRGAFVRTGPNPALIPDGAYHW
jgi:hypothetical protein